MNLKPYFYYRQQYHRQNKSNDENINSAEVTGEENTVSQDLSQTEGAGGKAVGAMSELIQEENLEPILTQEEKQEPILTFEHSRFQEVAPGVFQFKHPRVHSVQHPQFLAWPSQPEQKPEVDEFVRVGVFPGAGNYKLPVYQFT